MEKKEYVKPAMEIIKLESKTPVLQDCSNVDWNDEVGHIELPADNRYI